MTEPLPLLSDVSCDGPSDDAGFGALATDRGPLPLKAMDVQGRIDGLVSEVSLRQTFVNAFDVPLEATYIFPLPDRAAVSRFRMEVGGRVIEGALKERGQARQEYDQALRQGHRAAITEEERPGVFTLRVGNLMPGETATVHLTLTGPLTYSDGEATFRFPLVVAPRYIPGTPLPGPSVGDGTAPDTDAVSDASRITPPVLLPGYPNPVRLSLAVELHPCGLPVGDIRCSLHAVRAEEDLGVVCITLHPGERLNRDFVLRFRLGADSVKSSLVLKPDGTAREGTFLLTLVPPATAARTQRPRDVAFVLDRSGSMEGWKMVAARRALARMVDTLTERDRFTVLAFDNAIEQPFAEALVSATDHNRFRAVQFLTKVEARGGTEMAGPLDRAVRVLGDGDAARDRVLVLVTDGQVGNEDQLLQLLGDRLREVRVFALGIDQAVNEAFLRRLAQLGGGACEVVESEQRLDEVLDRVHRRVGTPLLTGLRLTAAGVQIEVDSLVPARLPDLFAGAPLVIHGRYRGVPEGTVSVQARDAAGRSWAEAVPGRQGASEAVPALWARGHIRDLEDRLVAGRGDRTELERRIIATSLRYNVLSRFTAFVAVDRAAVVNAGGEVHKVTQAVEQPAGWANQDAERQEQAVAANCLACAAPFEADDESTDLLLDTAQPQAKAKSAAPAGRAMPAKQGAQSRGRATERLRRAVPSADREAAEKCDGGTPAAARAPASPPCPAGLPPTDGAAFGGGPGQMPPSAAEPKDGKEQIEQLTADHSLAQALVESKSLAAEEARDHRWRNILWKYLGSKEVGAGPEVMAVSAAPGDRFLLCTDGLTGVVSDDQLLSFIRGQADTQACADGLGKLALDSGSRDNVSCVVVEVAAGGALHVGQCSLLGNYRENNEDSIMVQELPDWTVCVVADGMGGQAAGEIASKRAVDVLLRELRRSLKADAAPDQIKAVIRQAVVQANEEIIAMGALDRDLKNMGTTVVLAVWQKGSAVMYVTNVGDSRCYLMRTGGRPAPVPVAADRRASFWKPA